MQDLACALQALCHQVPPRDQRIAINLFYSRGNYSTEIKNCSRPPGGRQKPLSPQNHLLGVSTRAWQRAAIIPIQWREKPTNECPVATKLHS